MSGATTRRGADTRGAIRSLCRVQRGQIAELGLLRLEILKLRAHVEALTSASTSQWRWTPEQRNAWDGEQA